MSEDPERLLRRLRAPPSPAFLARLKARLDAQTPMDDGAVHPPSASLADLIPASRLTRAASRRPWRVALPVLLGTLGLVLIELWQRQPLQPREPPPAAQTGVTTASPHAPVSAPGARPTRPPAAEQRAPLTEARLNTPVVPGKAGHGGTGTAAAPAGEGPRALTAGHPRPTAPSPSALAVYGEDLRLRFLVQPGSYDAPGMRIEVSSVQPLCPAAPQEPGSDSEPANEAGERSCPPSGDPGVEKTLIGHEVAFLARSARSGALPLSTRAIFLALARQVPDPSHPELLVSNPYRLWSDIDPALPAEPIHVAGPPQSSQPGGALLAVLLTPGCRRVLPQVTDASQCQAVRSDDVYVEMPDYRAALVPQLKAHPTWLGLFNLTLLAESREQLAVSPVDDAVPAAATVLSGAYPAARSVYLDVSTRDLRTHPVLGNVLFRYRQLLEAGTVGGPDAALVSAQELRSELLSP